MSHVQGQFDDNTPQLAPKERHRGDLMYKQVAFVYPVTITRGELGGQKHTWATTPIPTNCSAQISALEGQPTEPDKPSSRILHIYSRKQNSIGWHDRVIFDNITFQAAYVEEKFDNFNGQFTYVYARCHLISEKDFVDGTDIVIQYGHEQAGP